MQLETSSSSTVAFCALNMTVRMVEQSRSLNVSRMYCSVHEGCLLWWSHVTRVQNNLFNDGGFHFSEIIWHKLLTVLPRFTLKKQSKSHQFHNQNLGCKKLYWNSSKPHKETSNWQKRISEIDIHIYSLSLIKADIISTILVNPASGLSSKLRSDWLSYY